MLSTTQTINLKYDRHTNSFISPRQWFQRKVDRILTTVERVTRKAAIGFLVLGASIGWGMGTAGAVAAVTAIATTPVCQVQVF